MNLKDETMTSTSRAVEHHFTRYMKIFILFVLAATTFSYLGHVMVRQLSGEFVSLKYPDCKLIGKTPLDVGDKIVMVCSITRNAIARISIRNIRFVLSQIRPLSAMVSVKEESTILPDVSDMAETVNHVVMFRKVRKIQGPLPRVTSTTILMKISLLGIVD